MEDPQDAASTSGPSLPAIRRPATPSAPTAVDRQGRVVGGGLLAGVGLSIAVVLVMHVIQAATNNLDLNLDPYMLLALFVVGPIFGLGVGVAISALIPPDGTDSRTASGATADPG